MSERIVDLPNGGAADEYTRLHGAKTLYGYDLHEEIVRCRDCENSHMTDDGKFCKWCSVMATHEIDTNGEIEPPNGYDPEPYFDADFFCGFGKARSER